MKKSTSGFTLVELIVAIGAAAIVMAAAVSFMLLGLRMEHRSNDVAERQRTAHIMLTMTEKLAVSGSIKSVSHVGTGWILGGENDETLLQYKPSDGSLRVGDTVLMRDLVSASADLDSNTRLFTIEFETEFGKYSSKVYCRDGNITQSAPVTSDALLEEAKSSLQETREGRIEFLTKLCAQYGSRGEIKYADSAEAVGKPKYFSEWYVQQKGGSYGLGEWSAWNQYTPWCACYLSWAAGHDDVKGYLNTVPCFAEVDNALVDFQNSGDWRDNGATPDPGDLIFFDWDNDTDPDHVGAVICVKDGEVYTIEGNSGGQVNVNHYPIGSADIMGYGVLDWEVPENIQN